MLNSPGMSCIDKATQGCLCSDSKPSVRKGPHHQLVLCSHVRRQPLVVVVARVPLNLHLVQIQQNICSDPAEVPQTR
jgi:hypothetical protein